MKNNLPYFSHDSDSCSHWKHEALRARYDWAGYGRFWALNELISRAENCQLRIGNPLIRASSAAKIGFSVQDFDTFIAFLADPTQCGLVHILDGILTTDRTQEDLEKVNARRNQDRTRYLKGKGAFRAEKQDSAQENIEGPNEKYREQSILDKTRLEQSNGAAPPAACPLFPVQEVKNRLAFSPATDITLDDAAAEQLAATLQAAGCEDLDYLDWALDRVAVRAKGKPIDNPAGYLLSVAGLANWVADWRRERAFRVAIKRTAGPAPPGEPAVALGPMLSEYVKSGGPGGGARRQG